MNNSSSDADTNSDDCLVLAVSPIYQEELDVITAAANAAETKTQSDKKTKVDGEAALHKLRQMLAERGVNSSNPQP